MTTILTDSMARDHAATMQALAAASRRARSARQSARAARRAERRYARDTTHPRAAAVSHAAARPFTAMHHWLVAGELSPRSEPAPVSVRDGVGTARQARLRLSPPPTAATA